MGGAASAVAGVKEGDLVERMQCHACQFRWSVALVEGQDDGGHGECWSCPFCTLLNESGSRCQACEAPRGNRSCPRCQGEFVERLAVGIARGHLDMDASARERLEVAAANASPNPTHGLSVAELMLNMAHFRDPASPSAHSDTHSSAAAGDQITPALRLALARQHAQPHPDTSGAAGKLDRLSSADDPDLATMAAYEKETRLGQGAHGCAMLVKRKRDGKKLVAKQIAVDTLSAAERADAEREVQVMQTLKHPNIITLHKSFFEEGYLYIVMEWAQGGDLADFLKRSRRQGPLEEGRVLTLLHHLLNGLEHVHAHKLLHRDIKPANVLLSSEGVAKLADFGISRVMSSTLSQAHTMIGTPYYLSPEMIEDRGYSYPSDVWSAGVLAYELLSYKHPFQGANLPALIMSIMKAHPCPIPSRYSAEIQELVNSMMSFDPQGRPSVSELLASPVFAGLDTVDLPSDGRVVEEEEEEELLTVHNE